MCHSLEGPYHRTEFKVPRMLISTSDNLVGPQLTFRNEDVEKKERDPVPTFKVLSS